MIELERTFLAKYFPHGLLNCSFVDITDVYFPASSAHPKLRLRRRGNYYLLTKKVPINDDSSRMEEQTIKLSKSEFESLLRVDGHVVSKRRFFFPFNGLTAEVDVFRGDLSGLVLVDFEFNSVAEKDGFVMPDFCLADVTAEEFIAGGVLCGKSYSDLIVDLNRFGYKRLIVDF